MAAAASHSRAAQRLSLGFQEQKTAFQERSGEQRFQAPSQARPPGEKPNRTQQHGTPIPRGREQPSARPGEPGLLCIRPIVLPRLFFPLTSAPRPTLAKARVPPASHGHVGFLARARWLREQPGLAGFALCYPPSRPGFVYTGKRGVLLTPVKIAEQTRQLCCQLQ